MDFYTAFNFLLNHPIYNNRFVQELDVDVVKVNPETNEVDDLPWKNTKTQVWLESGEYLEEEGMCCHNYDLDCGGDTYEEAIIELAKLVKMNFTDEGKPIRTRMKVLEDIEDILLELNAREESNNCVVNGFSNLSWIELCNKGVELFQELIKS